MLYTPVSQGPMFVSKDFINKSV